MLDTLHTLLTTTERKALNTYPPPLACFHYFLTSQSNIYLNKGPTGYCPAALIGELLFFLTIVAVSSRIVGHKLYNNNIVEIIIMNM